MFYESLPEDDPHRLPSDAERREMRRLRTVVRQLARGLAMYPDPQHPYAKEVAANLDQAKAELARVEAVVLGALKEAP